MKTLDWLAHQEGLAFVPQVRRESALRPDASGYTLNFAASAGEVEEAQRLRFKVFAEEMGANLPNPERGLDVDAFDAHCEHLLVRNRADGKVVGAYRLLPPETARRIGGFYSETEFDLSRLAHLRDGGHAAANLYRSLREKDFVGPEYKVFPTLALPVDRLANDDPVSAPPLVKGYLRVGAQVGGAPAWDPDFNSADLFMLLNLAQMNPRYARHFT